MKKKTKTLPAFEAVEDAKEPSSGKDELNLAEFPIALLSEKAPAGVKTLEFKDQIFDSGKRKLLNRRLTIEGSETYGLPTAKDDEVILAFIQLSKRQKFHDKMLHFTRFELIKLLGWPNTGQTYSRIELALRRWVSVTLHYENAWWDKTEERWTSGAFHIIDEFELNDSREVTSQMTLLTSRIIWSNRVYNSFVEGHLKNIRYDVYVRLRSAVSKRMYRFLDKRFHHSKSCTFDLRDFAHEHIGLSRSYRDCGKLKEKLDAGMRELEEIGFLEPMTHEQRYQQEGRGRWRVTFVRNKPKSTLIPTSGTHDEKAEAPLPPLIAKLTNREVTETTAVELVARYPAGLIETQIEVFDWLVQRRDNRVDKSPAGYLVQSMKDDYAIPKGFVPRAERDRLAAAAQKAQQTKEEERRREREQEAAERAERQAIDAYWATLTPEQQRGIEAESASAETLAMPEGPVKRLHLHNQRIGYIRRLLQAECTLPVTKA